MDTTVDAGALAALGCPWRAQDRRASTAIGATLIIIGVSAVASLSWLGLHLLAAKPRLPSQLLLLQLCSAALVCTALAGFPFSGTSTVAGHWLYGAKGCVAQAFIQHMGVAVQLWTLAALAMERWLHCRPSPLPPPPPPPPAHWYGRALLLPWLLGAAVSAPPLVGWGSFGCDVSGSWCSINWGGGGAQGQQPQGAVALTYVLFALLAGRLIPATVTMWCLCGAGVAVSGVAAPRPACGRGAHAAHAAHAALTAVTRLAASGLLLLRVPRLLLDLHLAAGALSWDRAPAALAYVAPVADEASALVLPLACALVERSCCRFSRCRCNWGWLWRRWTRAGPPPGPSSA